MHRIDSHAERRRRGQKPVRELRGTAAYEYYPLGRHVVVAPGVCGGRPTFKGTRVEVRTILDCIRDGHTVAEVLEGYPSVSRAAIKEAIRLAAQALAERCALQAA
ncbi:MAG: DUF433 domain-containing protein [Verrucomicrobia bacterium]|nr:DUF433 domain-containing protein [Verrucomicrobiota bacterium]